MSCRHLLPLLLFAVPSFAQLLQPVGSVPFGQNSFYAVTDFNLDGSPDFIKASATQGLALYLGNPTGGFALTPTGITTLETPTNVFAGDFNGDGRPDVAILSNNAPFADPSARVFLGSGTGTFTARPAAILQDFARASTTGDFDQDGNLDVAIITTTPAGVSRISVIRGNGSGDLTSASLVAPVVIPVPANSAVGDMQAVDLNGDKRLDLVMTISNTSGVGLAVALSNGFGSFTVTANMGTQPPQLAPLPKLAITDFNGDRNPDVVMFGYLRDQVTLWINSAGALIPQTASSIGFGPNPYSIAAADWDLDGRVDLAVARQISLGSPELHIALGDGSRPVAAAPGSPYAYGGPTPLLQVGDFNSDRRQDLLVLEGANAESFRILLNVVPRPPTMLTQQINFPQPNERGLNDGPLTLNATAGSGLPVTYAGLSESVCTVNKGVVTFLSLGSCTILAIQPGDSTYSPAPSVQRTFTVARNAQTITFAPLPDRTLDAVPFEVTATSSAGLPVTFVAGPESVCTLIPGNRVVLVAVGQCSVTAQAAGNATFPAAVPVTRTFSVTQVVVLGPSVESIGNAASYVVGTVAPASYGVLFGQRLTGATLKLRDSAAQTVDLTLIFSGATQINFIVPPTVAPGAATVTVTTPVGTAEFPVTIASVAPGLFSATGTGQGLAAAQALIVNNDKTVTTLTVGNGPIPVRGGTEIYLVLYGTGIRAHTPTGVFVTVAGSPVEWLYAGPQGEFPALDQINVKVPLTVGGLGVVDIRVIVDGSPSNVVTANFQ